MRNFFVGVIVAAILLSGGRAFAQAGPPQSLPASAMCATCTAIVSATNSSSRVALPSTNPPYNAVTLSNSGTKDLYWKIGPSTVTATASNNLLRANTHVTVWASDKYVAAITGGTDTTTLDVIVASGPVDVGSAGEGSNGSSSTAVTVADGADVTQGAKADAAQTDQTQTATVVSILKGLISVIKTQTAAIQAGVIVPPLAVVSTNLNPTTTIATTNSHSYTAGKAMGVPTAISVARTNGASVTISWIHIPINDGSTNAVCFMIFNQALTTSTFTDTNTVALTQADHGKWVKTMCGTPAVTPGLSGVSELDFDNLNIPIVPGVASQSIYIGEYSNATQTPGTSPNTTVNIGLAQN